MKILNLKFFALVTLILGVMTFLREEEKMAPDIDAIKMKVSAPKRVPQTEVTRAFAIEKKDETQPETEAVTAESDDFSPEEDEPEIEEEPEGRAPAFTENSEKNELNDYLGRMDPVHAPEISNQVASAQDEYQAELAAIQVEARENGKVTADEQSDLTDQVRQKYDEKLKEILGSHYDEAKVFIETPGTPEVQY